MVVVFLLLFGTYCAFATTDLYEERVFHPYLVLNAKLAGAILVVLGHNDVRADGVSVSSPEFGVTIARGCDGIQAMALFVAALFAFPAAWRLKLPALPVCLPLLAILNLLRIVSLYLVGIYYPDLFHVMHVDVWQAVYILFALSLFGLWLGWATWMTQSAAP